MNHASISVGSDRHVCSGETGPRDHRVEVYPDDQGLLDALTAFVATGLNTGEGVVVIATAPHLLALEDRLDALKLPLDAARSRDQYIALDADATLSRFMDNGWPDSHRFRALLKGILARARGDGRRVRAFGEMVAILRARGFPGATVQLEHLWHDICRTEASSLFCAYPKPGVVRGAGDSVRETRSAPGNLVGCAAGE